MIPQKVISSIFGNPKVFLIFLTTGFTIEEIYYGLRIIKYLGII